jgi:hypothetical protein
MRSKILEWLTGMLVFPVGLVVGFGVFYLRNWLFPGLTKEAPGVHKLRPGTVRNIIIVAVPVLGVIVYLGVFMPFPTELTAFSCIGLWFSYKFWLLWYIRMRRVKALPSNDN